MSTSTPVDPTAAEAAPPRPPWSRWRVAAAIGGAAAAVRLAWVAAMSREPVGLTDLTLYPLFAEGIASGRGYLSLGQHPTAYYPPGYPLFLGGLQWLLDRVGLGDHLVLVAGLVQALLGGLAVAAVVVAADRLGGRRVAVVAGIVMAAWPNLVMHTSAMLSETLFIAVFSVTLAALLLALDGARWWSPALVVAALGLGACTLIRPQSTLLALPAVAVTWALSSIGWRRWGLRMGALLVGVVVVVAPWTIRNAVVLGGFVPVSTNTGDNLCMGFNPDTTGGFMVAPSCETGEFYVQGIDEELRRDAEARRRAIDWATGHPGELPGLSLRKLQITYANDRDGLRALESFEQDRFLSAGTRSALGLVADVYFFTVLAAALVGLVLCSVRGWRVRRDDPAQLLLVLTTLSAAMVPVVSFADTRFKVPVAPCYAILAAVAAVAAWEHARGRRTTTLEDTRP